MVEMEMGASVRAMEAAAAAAAAAAMVEEAVGTGVAPMVTGVVAGEVVRAARPGC